MTRPPSSFQRGPEDWKDMDAATTLTKPQVHTPAGLTKADVSVEAWREYVFTDGFKYRIEYPVTLFIKRKPEGDSHRVVDVDDVVHYIPVGWRILKWESKDEARPIEF